MVPVTSMEELTRPLMKENERTSYVLPRNVTLQISIVTYFIDQEVIELLDSLEVTAGQVKGLTYAVMIVENGYKDKTELHQFIEKKYNFCEVFISGANLGYGKAHNLAINPKADYHLVLNPDVIFCEETLGNALRFMQEYPECGLLSPQAFWRNGDRQYLCKRYPTLATLFLRAFAPVKIQDFFRTKMESYCMKEETQGNEVLWQPFSVSGCFMLFRNDVFLQLGGFDSDYFLYFEDTDLSCRAGKITRIAYVPMVKITHHGGNVSRKGIKHILMFTRSMIKFFNKYGWRIC